MSITKGIVSSQIQNKRTDFNFVIVNFSFLDGDVPHPLHMVYIFLSLFVLQECVLILVTSTIRIILTAKLLKQGYKYHKIRKAFSKFYHRHSKSIVKYNIGLKTILQQGILEPIFYGDLVDKFQRIV